MIANNPLRIGNFTSSEIVALTEKGNQALGFGVPAITYIEEKNMERRHGCSISTESNARPLLWGKLLEPLAFDELGLEYSLTSQETILHPTIPYWSGSPDGFKDGKETVVDEKCPITRKSFSQLVDPLYNGKTGMDAMNIIRAKHKDGNKYYWQLVSNATIVGSKYAELIVYMPYLSQIPDIKFLAEGNSKYYWVWAAGEEELPYLRDGGYYNNLNIIRFEVPQKDKDYLTALVEKAGTLLNNQPSVFVAGHDKEVDATIVEPAKLES
jgi:hypothetical protein